MLVKSGEVRFEGRQEVERVAPAGPSSDRAQEGREGGVVTAI